jgi:GT2 family glycosyltransferase
VTRLQERLAGAVEIERVERFGDPPLEPTASIVVPLYQRIDLLERQLASFADDRDLREADLIYVLDSPDQSEKLLSVAADLYEIYRVAFRVAELSRNGGFSVANNLGASLAKGRLLLLLNSDVLPAEAGWLPRLVEFHDSRPKVGAVAPKLLFDDETLQHAGLYWRRPARHAAWENAHYFKGLHRELPAANVARPVPAATAACLLISSDLYREVGGLRSIYIQGDYEDSDLCLRLREAGYETWYLPEVELYHLEGRSYDTSVRQTNARYNSWLHTRLWGREIEGLMCKEEFASAVGAWPSP